jgi:hypothetical protein
MYAGETVSLLFEVTTDPIYLSHFFLDDISLSASATAAAPEPNQGQDLSGVTFDKNQFEGLK